MALDTYANLKTAIGNFLNRSDLTAVIPDFITLAEAQLMRRLTKRINEEGKLLPRSAITRNTGFTIDAETVNVPGDFLGPLTFSIDDQAQQLTYLSPESFAAEKARRGSNAATGLPEFYTVIGSVFQFCPAPDTAYTGTLVYWTKLAALSDSNASNWILANHPDVYLYGALAQSAPYLMDDARLTIWGGLFTAALEDMLDSDPMPVDGANLRTDDGLTGTTAGAYAWSSVHTLLASDDTLANHTSPCFNLN